MKALYKKHISACEAKLKSLKEEYLAVDPADINEGYIWLAIRQMNDELKYSKIMLAELTEE